MTNNLSRHKEVWQHKKILRVIYEEWYEMILRDLAIGQKKTLELGSGSGNFKDYYKMSIASDIERCDWIDLCLDAHYLPFQVESLDNIVMIDVLHHLSNPLQFFYEALRVLEKGGRIVMIEPFPSPLSLLVYKLFHPEPFIMDEDLFYKKKAMQKDPWQSNQAIAHLLFFQSIKQFRDIFYKKLEMIKREKMSFILYPASGGFDHKALIPNTLIPYFQALEKLLSPLKNFIAFRCYIVLEKIDN